jgi:uncharacterized NAD-dependent epimerase/dehydratase family protein
VTEEFDGNALVYCEGAFNTPNGKTAHGLVRFTQRYRVLAVVDSTWSGRDAGEVLDGRRSGIPIVADVAAGLGASGPDGERPTHLVIGLAPDGGRLPSNAREHVFESIEAGLHVDAGLHEYLSEDHALASRAAARGVQLRDVRKPPATRDLHFFTGRIEQVGSTRIAVLGTDSAVGKRTTAVSLVQSLRKAGVSTEMIGTGQTSWMQGLQYGIILDSLVNDFVSGEIEHVIWRAWNDLHPDCLVLEGQGSLMNPAYPGGFELLAAGRPRAVVLQHAPARKDYDGFPGYPIEPLSEQIRAIETVSHRPVVAITLNHEGLEPAEVPDACAALRDETGLPCFDVLHEGADRLADHLVEHLHLREGS